MGVIGGLGPPANTTLPETEQRGFDRRNQRDASGRIAEREWCTLGSVQPVGSCGRSRFVKTARVVATGRGGPEELQVVEEELPAPSAHEVWLQVLAAPVSLPDVEARYGRTPFPPRLPFTPGYAAIGEIEVVGEGVKAAEVGDRVAALLTYGGYAERLLARESQLIPMPASVDPVEAAPLILNYIVAYLCLHRDAQIRPGETVLIVGASGGIGTAFLDLGRSADLKMYALASEGKHGALEKYGSIPIDYRSQDFAEEVRRAEPEGIDAIFDGIGGEYISRGFPLLKPGGRFVTYANPLSLPRTFFQLAQVLLLDLFPNGRSASYYSTGRSRLNPDPFLEDWAELFRLLATGQIHPVIDSRFPIREAAAANRRLESGEVIGNIVLVGQGEFEGDGE